MGGMENRWVSLGRSQMHLPTNKPQVVRGTIGLVVPELELLTKRLARVAPGLQGTEFGFEVRADHVAATSAGLLAAKTLDLPVLGWTLAESVAVQLEHEFGARFAGDEDEDIDLRATLDRIRQRLASREVSQAAPGSVLWRRLELLVDTESLRWMRLSDGLAGSAVRPRP